MNKKQIVVLCLGIVAIILIVVFTPKYKLSWSDDLRNYIITEQNSSLYKRSQGTVKLHWDKIIAYSGITVLACGILMFAVGSKNG